jgi:alpha-1,6-mannosyltransferase
MSTAGAGVLRSEAVARLVSLAGPAAGLACLALLAVAVASAHPSASPLSPDHAGGDSSYAWLYLGSIAAAFALYLAGLAALSLAPARLKLVLALAVVIQVAPLAGPVLLSTDVYTYWAYGRISAVHGENPYETAPDAFVSDPAYAVMGADWRDTTAVYGPAFTLLSEGHALAVGDSSSAAAWTYRGIATASMLALVALAATLGRRRAFCAAFVGWNPLLAVQFAGGGHNDALMMALVLGALALAAAGRPRLAGASWAVSIAIKWVPAVFLVLRAVEARASGRPVRHLGFALAAGMLGGLAFWRYGLDWLGSVVPLARNLERQAVYSVPNRLADLTGMREGAASAILAALLVVGLLWLLREAWRGRARLGLSACFLLIATPWLVPWYAVWAVPLAAIEEDRMARLLSLGMCAYLLRDAVPL